MAVPSAAHRLERLLAERDFRVLLGAQFVAQAADGFAQAVFADRLILDPLDVGTAHRLLILFAITLVPYSGIAPFLGVFVDRWPRRTIMWVANAARSLPLALLALPQESSDTWSFVGVVALLGLGRLFLVTKGASLPYVVHERDLLRANAISSGGGMIAALLGGVTGLAALGVMTPRVAFALGAVAYAGAALIARALSDPMGHTHVTGMGNEIVRIARDLVRGLREISSRARARLPILAVFVVRTAAMLVTVATIVLINRNYAVAADRRTIGALALGAAGAGAFLAAVLAPMLGRRLLKPGLIVFGFLVSGLGIVLVGGIAQAPYMLVLTFTGGFGTFTAKIAVDAEVQEALPDEYRGRAFAVYDILYNLASVIAAAALVATNAFPLRGVLVIAGLVTLAVAGILTAAMRRHGMMLIPDGAPSA